MSQPEQIAVIGAGLMGHGIAQIFAMHGHQVRLTDISPDILNTAKERVQGNLTNLVRHEINLGDEVDRILERIETTSDMAHACAGTDVVFEAIFEKLDLKQKIFTDLDRMCPATTILCSNTSVMSITEIAEKSEHRERIIGTHFWNPPFLIPLVEVIRTKEASDWCVNAIYDLLSRVGKHPVHVHKDVPGFVGNRLQHALWREAFAIIDEGICDPETVDEVICNGFGLRLPILGPVETADMVGLDLTLAIHDYILKHINADPTPSTTLKAKVAAGELGFKSGKGFREWSKNDIAESRARLSNYLINVFSERLKQGKEGREKDNLH